MAGRIRAPYRWIDRLPEGLLREMDHAAVARGVAIGCAFRADSARGRLLREELIRICRDDFGFTWQEIGKIFDAHHTTVMQAMRGDRQE